MELAIKKEKYIIKKKKKIKKNGKEITEWINGKDIKNKELNGYVGVWREKKKRKSEEVEIKDSEEK